MEETGNGEAKNAMESSDVDEYNPAASDGDAGVALECGFGWSRIDFVSTIFSSLLFIIILLFNPFTGVESDLLLLRLRLSIGSYVNGYTSVSSAAELSGISSVIAG